MSKLILLKGVEFVPGTLERRIGSLVLFRPIKSWHSGSLAGEGLTKVIGDGSGCVRTDGRGDKVCSPPLSVTHRIYWNEETGEMVSSFLSYPAGMGSWGEGGKEYFWEIYADSMEDIERFGEEERMEERVRELIGEGSADD